MFKLPVSFQLAVLVYVSWCHLTKALFSPYNGNYYYYTGNFHISDNFTAGESSFQDNNFTKIKKKSINHYTMIGWNIEYDNIIQHTIDIFKEWDDQPNHLKIPVPDATDCYYIYHPTESGAELWGELVNHTMFNGWVPHFRGKSRVKVCLLGKQHQQESVDGTEANATLCGGFRAIFDYDDVLSEVLDLAEEVDDNGNEGLVLHQMVFKRKIDERVTVAGLAFMNPKTKAAHFTFGFDCPNFGSLSCNTNYPTTVSIQMAAFAEDIRTFDSVEEYNNYEEPQGKDFPLASQCFGSGEFLTKEEDNDNIDRTSYAIIVGHVIEVEKKTNELTGESFYWALIRTFDDVEIDVVIHPGLLTADGTNPPQVGGVIWGYFWLSGRLCLGEEDDESKMN